MFFRRDECFDEEIERAARGRLTTGLVLLVPIFTLGTIILSFVVDSLFTSAFGLYSDYQVKLIEYQILYSKNGLGWVLSVAAGLIIVFAAISLIYLVGFQLSFWWARLFGGQETRIAHHQVFVTAYLMFNLLLMIATPFAVSFISLYAQKDAVVILNIYLTKDSLLLLIRVFALAYVVLLIYMLSVFYRGSQRLYNFETPLANGGTAVIALLFPIIVANTVTSGWLTFIQTAIKG
jgi:hypothetical protein